MSGAPTVVEFGEFQLDRERFELRRSGVAVHLERQAFDLLAYLATWSGRVVSKEELLDNVWGTRFVTEAALTTQVKVIRKALGDDGEKQRYIRTVHRRGYEFVGGAHDVDRARSIDDTNGRRTSASEPPEPVHSNTCTVTSPGGPTPRFPLPLLPRDPLIGRDRVVEQIIGLLASRAVVSLTGPGGVGKTRLAVEVVHRVRDQYADGVCFVDLVAVPPGNDIADAVAEAAGTTALRGVGIADSLATSNMLVVLDNCEHVVESAANFVTRLTARTGDPARVLTTSREALDISAEAVLPIEALPTVPTGKPSPAAQLLLDRAELLAERSNLDDIERVAHLVDGLPLALELAASQLQFMSLGDLRSQLERRRGVLAATSPRGRGWRHRSLRSAVEWSWALLDDDEREMLVRLSVFPFDWTLDAAEHLCGNNRIEPMAVLRQLHAKSLITATMRAGLPTRYRLLFGVREFASSIQNDNPVGAPDPLEQLAGWLTNLVGDWSLEEQWVSFEYVDIVLVERTSLRSAIEHCLATADNHTAAQLVAACAPAFRYGVGINDGRRWIDRLQGATLAAPLAARLALAGAEANDAFGDTDNADRYADRACTLATGDEASAPTLVAALIQRCRGRLLTDPDACLPLLRTAVQTARDIGASRLEATAMGTLGIVELGADGNTLRALTTAATAEQRCAAVGRDRLTVATLWGTAYMLAGQPSDAADHFGRLAGLAHETGLGLAAAVYGLLEAMCRTEAETANDLEQAIDVFVSEFHRSTGHGGRADAILALAYRAAVHGETTTAAQLLDAIDGRRLASQVSYLFARRAAQLIGRRGDIWHVASIAQPQIDRRLEALLEQHLPTAR